MAKADEKLSGDVIITKTLRVDMEPVGDRCVRFVCSTDTIDSANDRIMQDGWILSRYIKNPVLCWGHQTDSPPIGRAVQVGVEDGRLVATFEFAPASNPLVGDQAEGVLQLIKGRFLNAVSVGFSPGEWEFTTDEARGAAGRAPGVDFISGHLLAEISIVCVPANPDALVIEDAAPPEPIAEPDAPVGDDSGKSHSLTRDRMLRTIRLFDL